jgi:hypothetical protein
MKDINRKRMQENAAILEKLEIVDFPAVKSKYLITDRFKFGGKKRTGSNSGKVGRAYRARQRSLVPTGRGK